MERDEGILEGLRESIMGRIPGLVEFEVFS